MLRRQWQLFLKFRSFLGPEVWRLFQVSIVVGLLAFGVESSFVFVLQGYIRALGLVPADRLFLPTWYPEGLLVSVVALFLAGGMRAILTGYRNYTAGLCQQVFIRAQRERILQQGLTHAHELSGADTVNLFADRVLQSGAVLNQMSKLASAGTSTLLLMAMGLRLAPLETVAGLAVLFVLMIPFRSSNAKMKEDGKILVKDSRRVTNTLIVGFRNHFLLSVYGLLERQISDGRQLLRNYEQRYRGYLRRSSLRSSYPTFVGIFVICGLSYVSVGVSGTSPAKFVSFLYVFIRISQGLGEMSLAFTSYLVSSQNLKSLYYWHIQLDAMPQPRASRAGSAVASLGGAVHLAVKNLSFSYPGGPRVLEDVSFSVKSGELFLVRGPSGSGKSTLLSLLLGLNTPDHGEISVNGTRLEEIRESLFKGLAYVGPEAYLVEGTVRENLLYGHPVPASISDSEIWAALDKAQLTREIGSLASGLDEVLKDFTQLSTGQKQRLAIARALLRHPSLLILDEATANLDAETEERFLQALRPLLANITTVAISHKSSFDGLATSRLNLERSPGALPEVPVES